MLIHFFKLWKISSKLKGVSMKNHYTKLALAVSLMAINITGMLPVPERFDEQIHIEEEQISESRNPSPVILRTRTHSAQYQLDSSPISEYAIQTAGQGGIATLAAIQAYQGNYFTSTLLAGFLGFTTHPQLVSDGIEIAKPHVNQAVAEINKKNCHRAMKRCPNPCQKFASLVTFGYYKPEPHMQKKSQ